MRKCKYTEKQVIKWANYYMLGYTLSEIEKMCGVPDATIWWSFKHRLPTIAPQISAYVSKKLPLNKYIRNRRIKMKDGLI